MSPAPTTPASAPARRTLSRSRACPTVDAATSAVTRYQAAKEADCSIWAPASSEATTAKTSALSLLTRMRMSMAPPATGTSKPAVLSSA